MSTNYYFINKQVQQENNERLEKLNFLNPETILKQLVETNLFEEVYQLEYKVNDFIDEIKQMAQLENSYIHICQNAFGWNTLFAKTEHFANYMELFLFYDSNIKDLMIVDEYDRELTWIELEKQFTKNERRRGDYIDHYSYDWSNSDDFS